MHPIYPWGTKSNEQTSNSHAAMAISCFACHPVGDSRKQGPLCSFPHPTVLWRPSRRCRPSAVLCKVRTLSGKTEKAPATQVLFIVRFLNNYAASFISRFRFLIILVFLLHAGKCNVTQNSLDNRKYKGNKSMATLYKIPATRAKAWCRIKNARILNITATPAQMRWGNTIAVAMPAPIASAVPLPSLTLDRI